MNTKTKAGIRLVAVATMLMISVMAGLMVPQQATGANLSDSFSIAITPDGDRGVIIDTTSISVTLVMNSTWTSSAIPVRSTGTIGPVEYSIRTSAPGDWTISADGLAGPDELVVLGLFKVNNAGAPADSEYNAVDSVVDTTGAPGKAVGASGGAGTAFEGSGVDMDGMALNVLNDLYIRLRAPTSTTTGNVQNITVTVTGRATP